MHQKGNVLFLILIAVALFAALSYAVTQSSRGDGNADSEQDQLKVSEFLNYATSIKVAVDRLRLINGCDADEINFWADGHLFGTNDGGFGWNADNPSSPVDGSCDVFDASGGGVVTRNFDASWFDSTGGAFGFMSVPIDGIGTTDANLATHDDYETIFWSWNIRRDLCEDLNERVGVVSPLASLGLGIGNDYLYVGGGDAGAVLAFEWSGHPIGCYCYDANECNFYYVLIER